MSTIVINQPTFLPWLGYFNLISRATTFVILDTVSFSRQSWQQRNRVQTANGVRWLTVPVSHNFQQSISEVKIDYRRDWVAKHLKTLYFSYKKASYFNQVFPLLERIYIEKTRSLCDLNVSFITLIMDYLGIKTDIIRASTLDLERVDRTNYILSICKKLNATTFLNGASGEDLYSRSEFIEFGVNLVFQDYRHPTYSQLSSTFATHLSIVDLLFNYGASSLEILNADN